MMTADTVTRRNRDRAVMLSRAVAGKGLSLLRSFVVLPLVAPAEFGVYRYVLAVGGYLAYLHFGALNALSLEYPRARAKDEGHEAAAEVLAAAWRSCAVGGLLSALLMAGVLLTQTELSAPVVAMVSALTGVQLLAAMVQNGLQAKGEFARSALLGLGADVLGFATMVVGAYAFGVAGLLIGVMVPRLLMVLLARDIALPRGWATLPWARWRAVARQGISLMSANMMLGIAITLDIVVLGSLEEVGAPILGFFGLGVMIAKHAQLVTQPMASVDTVKLSEQAGRAPQERLSLLDNAIRSMGRDAFVSSVVAFAATVVFCVAIPPLIPRYTPALPVVAVLLVGSAFVRWQRYLLHLLALFERLRWIYVASSLVFAIVCGGFWWLFQRGEPQAAVYGTVSAAAVAVAGLMLLATTARIAGAALGTWMHAARLAAVHLPLAILLFPAAWVQPAKLRNAAAVGLVVVLVVFGLFWPAAVRDAFAVLRAMLKPLLRRFRRKEVEPT